MSSMVFAADRRTLADTSGSVMIPAITSIAALACSRARAAMSSGSSSSSVLMGVS